MVMVLFPKKQLNICKKSKFLALNTQINAFNIGHHSLKISKVDF